jgi:DNA-binding response OmpR family regulator
MIAADWQFRTLVRAQLLEEGFEVKALPSLETALAYLIRSGEQPWLTIVDMQGSENEARALSDLRRLAGEAPLIVCGGILGCATLNKAALRQQELPPAQVLLRPFRVGDLVREVRRLRVWLGGSAVIE